ncbi:MAG: hypothetical protein ABUL58_00530, partial [Steroidobacter sp.]
AINLELAEQSEDAGASFDNVPFPDEADGGDPVYLESVTIEPLRLSDEDEGTDEDADENVDEGGDASSG